MRHTITRWKFQLIYNLVMYIRPISNRLKNLQIELQNSHSIWNGVSLYSVIFQLEQNNSRFFRISRKVICKIFERKFVEVIWKWIAYVYPCRCFTTGRRSMQKIYECCMREISLKSPWLGIIHKLKVLSDFL